MPVVEVRPSHIAGLGIFALSEFRPGEVIRRVEYVREVTGDAPLRPEVGERHDHCSYPDGRVMLVAFPDRHMNHSCDPNAYYRDDGDGITYAHARRAIKPGEEITVDYLINNAGGDSWACNCGAGRCRGVTRRSFFDLPVDIQREYLPLLAPWFEERFAERVAQLRL